MTARRHTVAIVVGGSQIEGWSEYQINSSLLNPVDTFTMSRPFDRDIYKLCQRDARVRVRIDGVTIVDGLLDDREKESDRETRSMMITGRSKVGRLVQESAPTIAYDGLDLVEVVKRLATPWYTSVVLSDARNREVRLGRGRKAAAGNEALVVKVKKKTWQVEPGQMRWKIINDLASEAAYMVWASADGRELIIGQPNYTQGIQFLISNPLPKSDLPSTAMRLHFKESNADRYSLIMSLGSGRGDDVNYGEATCSSRAVVKDGPGLDGIGRDFLQPKRLILSERTLANNEEAKQHAQRDMDRRDFNRQIVSALMPDHGQVSAGSIPTLYAPNTLARVIDEEQDPKIDGTYMLYDCVYRCTRDSGQTTELKLVPKGTVFAQ